VRENPPHPNPLPQIVCVNAVPFCSVQPRKRFGGEGTRSGRPARTNSGQTGTREIQYFCAAQSHPAFAAAILFIQESLRCYLRTPPAAQLSCARNYFPSAMLLRNRRHYELPDFLVVGGRNVRFLGAVGEFPTLHHWSPACKLRCVRDDGGIFPMAVHHLIAMASARMLDAYGDFTGANRNVLKPGSA
jgi:hypothetical protein